MSILAREKFAACMDSNGAELEFEFDHLLLALGSETNFFDNAGIRDWAVTMKNLSDAALLRNRMVAFLEEATLENDAAARRQWLTFVIAGGGFAGAETAGAVNDFVRETAKFYPRLGRRGDSRRRDSSGRLFVARVRRRARALCRTKIARAQSGSHQRRARGELRWLGRYAQQWHIDSCGDTHLDGGSETEPGGRGFAVSERERTDSSQMNISRFLDSPGCGPRAIARRFRMDTKRGIFFPPTAQHGMREAVVAAKNIERTILGQPLKPFRYRTMGMLASIGHHTGVASLFGFKFSGFIAWWMWRSIYLAKLPRLVKKLARHDRVDARSSIRPRHRTDDHVARCRRTERALGAHSRPTRRVAMDTTIVSALAGIVGSLCGGSASFATAWVTHKTRAKREEVRAELSKREALYGEFIDECSKHVMDSLERNLDKPERLLSIYALLNRIRLCASDAVLAQAHRAREIHHGAIFRAESFGRRISRARARRRR